MNEGATGCCSLRECRWLLPLLLAPALILRCWQAPFLGVDDRQLFLNSTTLKPETPWTAVLDAHKEQYNYYPVTMLRWKVERALWGDAGWPAGLRASNLFFHVLGALCLWSLLKRLGASAALAGFVAAAFALHPLGVESTAWPAEGKTAFAGCFALGAAWAYVGARDWKGYSLALALYVLALFSKPSALGIVAVLGVWELLGRPRMGSAGAWFKPEGGWGVLAIRLLPWAIVSALCIHFNVRAHSLALSAPPGGNLFTALLTDLPILAKYFLNLVVPIDLSLFYGVEPVTSVADGRVWFCGFFLLAACSGMLALARVEDRRLLVFGLLWFVAALGPNLNLVGLSHLMHDRFIYLSAPGFWLALVLAARGAADRVPTAWGALPAWSGALVLCALSFVWAFSSLERGALFGDTQALLLDALRKEPDSSYVQLFVADEFQARVNELPGRERHPQAGLLLQRRFEHLNAALAAPDFERNLHRVKILIGLGQMYYMAGDEARAVELITRGVEAKRVVKYREDLGRGWQVLGLIALKQGRPGDALDRFGSALLETPTELSIHLHRARCLEQLALGALKDGRAAEALRRTEEARQALRNIPEDEPAYREAQEMLRALDAPVAPAGVN